MNSQERLMRVIKSGLNARGIERHSKEYDAYIELTYKLFRESNEYKYIAKNDLVSFEQLDIWSNDRDMETEGMDDAIAWSDSQQMNY